MIKNFNKFIEEIKKRSGSNPTHYTSAEEYLKGEFQMKASEAYTLANSTAPIKHVLLTIKERALRGGFSCQFNDLTDAQVKALRDLGYIVTKSFLTTISWGPEF